MVSSEDKSAIIMNEKLKVDRSLSAGSARGLEQAERVWPALRGCHP